MLDLTRMSLEDMEDLMNDPSKELVEQLKFKIAQEVISRNKKLKECFDVMEQLKQNPLMVVTENSGLNVILIKYSKVKTIAGRNIIYSVRDPIVKQCRKLRERFPRLSNIVWRLYYAKREELEPIMEANKDATKCCIEKSVNFGINLPASHQEESQ